MKRKSIIPFFVLTVLFYMAANFAHPVTPTLIVERNLDSSLFGTAMAATTLTIFLFSPLWGKLCAYIPTKRMLLICGVGYAIGQTIFGMAYSGAMVIFGRVFAGMFSGGMITVSANHIINVSPPEKRARNLTALATIQTVAGACGYFVGGMLGTISVEAAFAAQVVTLLSCGILYFITAQDDTPFKVKPEKALSLRDANPFAAFAEAKKFMTPMLALLFIMMVFAGIGYNSFEQCFNYFIKDQFRLGSQYNGTIKAVIAIAVLIGNSTICTYLQKKTDTNKTFFPMMVLYTAVVGCIFIVSGFTPFVIIYVLFSVINAARIPLIQNIVASRATPENSNSVMGFYQAMNSFGSIFGALFAGIIYAKNPMLPFALSFASLVIATLFGGAYVAKYKKAKKAE